MKTLVLKLIPCLFAILLWNGCASPSVLSGLVVTVIDFKPVTATLLETQAILTLRFVNENEAAVAISGSAHKLYLNGTYVGKAVTQEPIALPRLNTATQKVTLYLENAALIQKFTTLSDSATISYRLESEVYVDIGEEKQRLKSVSSGQIDLRAFANAVGGAH